MSTKRTELLNTLLSLHSTLSPKTPDPFAVPTLVDSTLAALFPHYSADHHCSREKLSSHVDAIETSLKRLCEPVLESRRNSQLSPPHTPDNSPIFTPSSKRTLRRSARETLQPAVLMKLFSRTLGFSPSRSTASPTGCI